MLHIFTTINTGNSLLPPICNIKYRRSSSSKYKLVKGDGSKMHGPFIKAQYMGFDCPEVGRQEVADLGISGRFSFGYFFYFGL